MINNIDVAKQVKILIVDDSPEFLTVYKKILSAKGYSVITASNGHDAFEKLNDEEISLVLLDVVLPDISGYEILRQIKSNPAIKDTYVALISSLAISSENKVEGLNVGADAYLLKTISNKELVAQIDNLVRHKKTDDILRINQEKYRDISEKSQKALEESNAYLQSIIDNSSDIFIAVDKNHRIIFFNKTANTSAINFNLKGISVGSDILEYFDVKFHDQFKKNFQEALNGKSPSFEIQYEDKSTGKSIWINYRYSPSFDNENKIIGVLIIVVDISEQKQLRETLHKWEEAFRFAKWGIIIGSADGKTIEMMNPEFAAMHGYAVDELVNQPIYMVFAPEQREILPSQIEKAHHLGHYGWESTHIRRDGTRFPVMIDSTTIRDENNKIKFWVVNVQDITDRKYYESEILKAKEQVEKSERLYRLLAENSVDVIWLLDLDYNIRYLSPSVYKLLGYTVEECQNKGLGVLFAPESIIKLKVQLESLKFNIADNDSLVLELEGIHKSGKNIHLEVSVKYVINEKGEIMSIQGISRDITERTEYLNQLINAKEFAEKSEEKFRLIAENSNDVIWLRTDQEMVYVNPVFEKVFGIERQRIYENPNIFIETIHPEDKDMVLNKLTSDDFRNKGYFDHEYRIILPDNQIKWIHAKASPAYNNKGEIFLRVGVASDITKRKMSELELLGAKKQAEENEEMFKVMTKNVPGVIYQIRFRADGTYYFSYISERAFELFDFSSDPFSQEWNLGAQIPPEDKKRFLESIDSATINQSNWEYEGKILTGKGSIKWFRAKSSPMFINNELVFNGIMEDITDQEKAKNEIITAKEKAQENERKLILAQSIAKLGGWELDLDSGLFTFSDNFYKIFHTTAQEMGGYEMSIRDYEQKFVYHEDAWLVEEETRKAIETDDPDFSNYVEHRINYQDGGIGYIGVKFYILKDDKGRTIKSYGVNQDITDKKNIERELIGAKEKAEESDRLKTAFLQNMSHEIRTPMNAIIGFSGLLQDCSIHAEKIVKYTKIIQERSGHLLAIIDEILEISKIESGQVGITISSINLKVLFNELELFYNEYEKYFNSRNIDLRFNKSENIQFVSDFEKINHILKILVNNALKFTETGYVEIGYMLVKDNKVKFYVKDTGIGIPENLHDFIFERFAKVEARSTKLHGGTGLGLAIAKGLVKLLGGEIWLESKIDQGSTFYFTVPLSDKLSID